MAAEFLRTILGNMDSAGAWCVIESDPRVYTQLIKNLGAKGVQIEELWTMNESIFDKFRPVHGLIFLRDVILDEEPAGPMVTCSRLNKIYFAKQFIKNASATQMVINLLMNCAAHPDVDIGPELTKLKEFTKSFDPNMRGMALSNSQPIRIAHNSISCPFNSDLNVLIKSETFHFVGFLPIDGRLYELDSMLDGPVDLGPVAPHQNWLDLARPIIMNRIHFYSEIGIQFKLMALVSDRKIIYERQIEEHMTDAQSRGVDADVDTISRLRLLIECEDAKVTRYRKEMARCTHDYIPFIIALLKILLEQNDLMSTFEKTKGRAVAKKVKGNQRNK